MGFNNILGLINTIQNAGKVSPKQNTDLFSEANTSQDTSFFEDIVTSGVDKLKESPLGERLTNAGLGTEPIEAVGKNLLIETIFKDDEKENKAGDKTAPKPSGQMPIAKTPPLQPQEQIPQVAPMNPRNRVSQLIEQQKMLRQKLRGV